MTSKILMQVIIYFGIQISVFVSKCIVALVPTCLVYLWIIPYSLKERGYHAIGGEWILIIGTAILSFWGVHNLFQKLLEESHE